jgi:hypothetical protein
VVLDGVWDWVLPPLPLVCVWRTGVAVGAGRGASRSPPRLVGTGVLITGAAVGGEAGRLLDD